MNDINAALDEDEHANCSSDTDGCGMACPFKADSCRLCGGYHDSTFDCQAEDEDE